MEEKSFECPYCGETISMLIDTSEPEQTYIEDCEVCCRPVQVSYVYANDEFVEFHSQRI